MCQQGITKALGAKSCSL